MRTDDTEILRIPWIILLIGQDPPTFNRAPINKGPINCMSPPGTPPRLLKLIILIILGTVWVYRALGDMLRIVVSNSHFGKRSAGRVMTFFSFHFPLNDKFTRYRFGRPNP